MNTIISIFAAMIISCIFSSGSAKKISKVDDAGATKQGVNAVVNANNQLAFDLYSQLNEESKDSNIFFSPYSISVALTMTYEGAKGQTAKEMRLVLHIPEDASMRRSSFAKIYNEINKKDKKYKLSTANALWAQGNYKFLEEYTNNVEKYYGGKLTNLDFIRESEKSRQTINKWVEDQTNNKIKDLIPKGVINALTRLVLTNAIYFKGTWVKQFDEKEYHQRSKVETIFSCVKRKYGSSLRARDFHSQKKEVLCKLIAYNIDRTIKNIFYLLRVSAEPIQLLV